MTEDTTNPPTEEQLEESYSDESEYTIALNGTEYELNQEAREYIEQVAEMTFEKNDYVSCWWKQADRDDYDGQTLDDTIHSSGDPVLVIETNGPMVPWDRLDTLNVEMQEVGPESQLDRQMDDADTSPNERDNGNGLRTIDPDDVDDDDKGGKQIGRTHFAHSPQRFEEVPGPDGEEPDKIPPKPTEMGDEPVMVKWVPDNPEIEHTWSAGEAVIPVFSRIEWNVQAKADQPQIRVRENDKPDSHDHWETLLEHFSCQKVGELAPSQQPQPETDSQSVDPADDEVPDHFEDGKYGGDNWGV